MKANEVKFEDLLTGKLQYHVPLFQRTYSWDEDQWERLWDDILEVYRLPSPQRHFIGSIVTQPIPDAPEKAAKHMLIDGQQRMTTLLLLLAVVRFHAEDDASDPSLAKEIEETYLKNAFIADGSEERLKLRPTKRDSESFSLAMMGHVPDLSGRIGQGWVWFSKMIAAGDSEGQAIELRRLKERITLYLDLVSIKLEEADSPNRIFESLNNTGAKLEASDLVRNYLFMNIPVKQQDEAYEQIWFPMQETLSDSLDDFFWRYSMKDGHLTSRDDIFDDITALLRTHHGEDMVAALKTLSKFSNYYIRIKDPSSHETLQHIRYRLIRLNDWEIDVSYPLLLQLFDVHSQGHVTAEDVTRVLAMVESFAVRRTVCGVPTNRLRRIFVGMAQQCGKADDVVQSCRAYLRDNEWPEDGEFREKLVGYRLYNPARLARTRLVLHSLEESFQHPEQPGFSEDITIEHLMPQTLSDRWKKELGNNAETIQQTWLDTIGNLTLTGYNPALGNKPFAEKKALLEVGANFQLTKHPEDGVLRYNTWTSESIQERARQLTDRALRIWPR